MLLSAVEASGKLDFGELELELWDSRYMLRGYKEESKWSGWCRPSCIPISIIFILIVLVVVLSLVDQNHLERVSRSKLLLEKEWEVCNQNCRISLVESIPEGLVFNSSVTHPSTYDAWVQLIDLAKEQIEIGSFYWNLDDTSADPNLTVKGTDIFKRLMEAGTRRKIGIKIAQNKPSAGFPNHDTAELHKAHAAEVRSLNFEKLMGAGVLHTKMWVVDRKHVYIGSANFDWKSLTQVKELGMIAINCTCLAKDLGKIFDVYWDLGQNDSKIPEEWPSALSTLYGKDNPMNISFNGIKYNSYLSSSPPPFCATGRTSDLDAIIDVIDKAQEFVHIAVMDYSPSLLYANPPKFWPDIDNHLRSAALDRGVNVRLLVALWDHTRNSTFKFLKSLQDLNDVYPNVTIEVKLFEVSSTPEQRLIPFARVNHNKYMVTEKSAYVGTSNWSGDYFTNTAGVGFVVTPKGNGSSSNNSSNKTDGGDRLEESNFRSDLAQIFERDWNSNYTIALDVMFARYNLADLQDLLGTSSNQEDEGGSSMEVAAEE
ncbi:Phospholipase D3 [Orchesella cincta]|uniref:Phospholipase D3 n=1 Tax=Orchesella cincta TaxID=48709 RepID=A0A1D2MC15_ORCCI|nr:Phospholipase D3 [Orchesella cincta]